jgi:hypothetical protein
VAPESSYGAAPLAESAGTFSNIAYGAGFEALMQTEAEPGSSALQATTPKASARTLAREKERNPHHPRSEPILVKVAPDRGAVIVRTKLRRPTDESVIAAMKR